MIHVTHRIRLLHT